jgi:hypothetical protein
MLRVESNESLVHVFEFIGASISVPVFYFSLRLCPLGNAVLVQALSFEEAVVLLHRDWVEFGHVLLAIS